MTSNGFLTIMMSGLPFWKLFTGSVLTDRTVGEGSLKLREDHTSPSYPHRQKRVSIFATKLFEVLFVLQYARSRCIASEEAGQMDGSTIDSTDEWMIAHCQLHLYTDRELEVENNCNDCQKTLT